MSDYTVLREEAIEAAAEGMRLGKQIPALHEAALKATEELPESKALADAINARTEAFKRLQAADDKLAEFVTVAEQIEIAREAARRAEINVPSFEQVLYSLPRAQQEKHKAETAALGAAIVV